ncbi:MAG: hypothetical protein F4X59_13560 [Holophagales bacterium]|nr:hypothetical protein [Holophagales bacterium]MYC11140.1 hypothetical protein [Holophagales bacterium]
MKLMKHITIALVLCAIPAMAFGQVEVDCPDCTHVVSVYHGHGGLIATAADGAEMVTYLATCEGVSRSGELMPNADGVVSMLLEGDYACYGDDEDNSFEIDPVMDGGWYWITMETNSAVGGLVNMDVLENTATMITDAGDGVTTMMGKGAVLLTETASGRTGLLPNILPTMEMDPVDPTVCGFARNAAGGAATVAAGYSRVTSNCMLGDGGTITLATTTNGFTGATETIMNGGMVYRPAGTGTIAITVDLWGNHSGFFTTAPTGEAWLGQPAFAGTGLRASARLTGVTIAGELAAAGPGTGSALTTTATDNAGISLEAGTDVATVTIHSDDAYCSDDANHSAKVNLTATMADATLVTPNIKVAAAGATHHGALSFTVVCQASSANMGQELVPENPFPTE